MPTIDMMEKSVVQEKEQAHATKQCWAGKMPRTFRFG
jgi:hypothetical protein